MPTLVFSYHIVPNGGTREQSLVNGSLYTGSLETAKKHVQTATAPNHGAVEPRGHLARYAGERNLPRPLSRQNGLISASSQPSAIRWLYRVCRFAPALGKDDARGQVVRVV